jgi:hypothetical protein
VCASVFACVRVSLRRSCCEWVHAPDAHAKHAPQDVVQLLKEVQTVDEALVAGPETTLTTLSLSLSSASLSFLSLSLSLSLTHTHTRTARAGLLSGHASRTQHACDPHEQPHACVPHPR